MKYKRICIYFHIPFRNTSSGCRINYFHTSKQLKFVEVTSWYNFIVILYRTKFAKQQGILECQRAFYVLEVIFQVRPTTSIYYTIYNTTQYFVYTVHLCLYLLYVILCRTYIVANVPTNY